MSTSQIPVLPCMCASFRRASRAITQLYEDAFRPFGLTASQFTILQALSFAGEVSQGRIGTMLAMDSTTLTRTLKIMLRHRWVSERRGEDRRERHIKLAKEGSTKLKQALPVWEETQARLARRLGETRWHDLQKLTSEIALIATQSGV